ncbi:MAG: hypothetical protein MAG715_01207 [Methanonatronarchaeales archaeon]|nr:hypothetical protein [Methanonatronarchaeales archaeon]
MKDLDPERFGYADDPLSPGRESLGSYVDLYYFQTKLIHVLLRDPSLLTSVYSYAESLLEEEVAERVEHLGLESFFEKDFWEMSGEEKGSMMNTLFSGNEAVLMRRLGLGLPQSIEFLDDERAVRIRVAESLESHNFPRVDRPLCFFLAGFLAGMSSGRMGNYVGYEEKCLARGNRVCDFFIGPKTPYIGRMRNYLSLPLDRSSALPGVAKSMLRGTGGRPDYSVLMEHFVNTTLHALQYFSGEARPELGKRFHIFVLQQHNLGLLSGSPESVTQLRKAGREAGRNVARIGIASGASEKEVVALLPELLMRTGMGLVEFYRTGSGYEVRVEECAESTGLRLDDPVCHFETGLFSGFFQFISGSPVEGEEERCASSGGVSCVHRLDRTGESLIDLSEILDKTEGE